MDLSRFGRWDDSYTSTPTAEQQAADAAWADKKEREEAAETARQQRSRAIQAREDNMKDRWSAVKSRAVDNAMEAYQVAVAEWRAAGCPAEGENHLDVLKERHMAIKNRQMPEWILRYWILS